MANPFQDILNSLLPKEEEQTQTPNQVPYASFNEAAKAETEVPGQTYTPIPAAAPAPAALERSIAATPPVAPKIEATPAAPAEAPETPVQRLERLMSEMKGNRAKEMEDAQSRQLKANMIKGITENLGNVVAGAQAVNTRASVNPRQIKGFDVGDLVAGVEKKYKPEQEQLLAEYKMLQGANKPMTEYQRLMLAHMGKQLDQSALNSDRAMDRFDRGEGRRWDNQKFTQEEKQEISPAQAKEFAAVDKTLDSLEKIDGMNDFSTGPINGRIQKAMRFAGQGSPERVALQAQLNMVTSQYANAISGTAVGEGEFKRIQEQLPNENDAPDAFAAKLANFKETMENSRLRLLDTYQKAGKNLDKLKDRTSIADLRKNAGKDAAPSYPKQVRNGKGEVATVSNAEEEKEAKAEGFN